MEGHGVYRWRDGSVYKGEWRSNYMNGCGRKIFPGNIVEEGEWVTDMFAGDFSSCDVATARDSARKAEQIASESRMFMLKPDGAVKKSEGIDVDQHPIRYASGQEFLMPGPAGQLFDVPNDEKERDRLRKHAKHAKRIFDRYNIAMPPQEELKRLSKERERAYEEMLRRERKAAQEAITVRDDDEEEEEDEDKEEEKNASSQKQKGIMGLKSLPFGRRKQQQQQETLKASSSAESGSSDKQNAASAENVVADGDIRSNEAAEEDEDDQDEEDEDEEDEGPSGRAGGKGLFSGRRGKNNTACMSVAVSGNFRPVLKRARRLPRLRATRINDN
jgi:hypothetical protein